MRRSREIAIAHAIIVAAVATTCDNCAARRRSVGVGLGGPTAYAHGVEDRPRLGSGPPPTPTDLRRAAQLSQVVATAATMIACAIAISRERLMR